MATVNFQLATDTELKLRQPANLVRQTLEAYLEPLAERAVANGTTDAHGRESAQQPTYISDPRPTIDELQRLLANRAAGPPLPVLPADFSRADICHEHD
jgi:hypothetical protein